MPFERHVQAEYNTDTPTLQDDKCRVHRPEPVCDLFDKYDGTGVLQNNNIVG